MKKEFPYKDTEKRIKKLCQENDITLEELKNIIDFSSVEHTCNLWNGKQAYNIETAKKIVAYFKEKKNIDIDYKYLTYKSPYKNYNDMIEKTVDKKIIQQHALYNFLDSKGFKWLGVKCFELNNNNFGIPWDYKELMDSDNDYPILDTGQNNAIIAIQLENSEIKYIRKKDIEQLTNDFFTLLENRFIDNINL